MIDVRLAYSTRAGLAQYIGGSGLAGEPRYTLAGRVWPHSAIVALAGVRRQKGRVCPPREEHRMSEEIAAADSLLRTNADLRSEIAHLRADALALRAALHSAISRVEDVLEGAEIDDGIVHVAALARLDEHYFSVLKALRGADHPGVALLETLARLQTALAWYADVSHYDDRFAPGVVDPQDGTWHIDCGSRARAALKGS